MAAIQRLSRQHSQMTIQSNPFETSDESHGAKMKVENLSAATLIKPEDLAPLIKTLTLDDNEEILRLLDDLRAPYLFTSDDLAKIIEVTTSVKTKIAIIGLVGPRLVDPKSKTNYFTGLFRYAEEKSQVEEILKARTQTLASAVFAKNDGIRTFSGGRGVAGRGGGAGRGGAGRGPNSRPPSTTTSPVPGAGLTSPPSFLKRVTSEDSDHLLPTASGFDDVLSALDDIGNRVDPSKPTKQLKTVPSNLNVIDENNEASPNSSFYDPRTTNDSSSVDSNNNGTANNSPAPRAEKETAKIVLNAIESCSSMTTKDLASSPPSRNHTNSADDDVSSISSMESSSRSSSGSRILKVKSMSYVGNLSSSYDIKSTPEKEKLAVTPFQSIRDIQRKLSENAVRTPSKDEQELSHDSIAGVTSNIVSDRTKAIFNPLLKQKSPASDSKAKPTTIGKVNLSIFNKPASTSASSTVGSNTPPTRTLNAFSPSSSSSSSTTKALYIINATRPLSTSSARSNNSDDAKSAPVTPGARCGTPRLPVMSSSSLPVLSNYVPEKTNAGGSGNFNYDLATRCATVFNLAKDDFLALPSEPPKKVIDGVDKYSYRELVRRNFVKDYGGLTQHELEKHLVDEDFPLAFQKSKDQFFTQVKWRQLEQKKKALLF